MTPNLQNLYLICSHSCMSQMEVPFLLNNSPNLWGSCDPDENWAEYDLPNLHTSIDCEPGPFGSVRVHDDYWNIPDHLKFAYNFEVRNTLEITNAQLDNLHEIPQYTGPIALLLHAHNTDLVYEWTQKHNATLITTAIGRWHHDIEMWAMREYNLVMEDPENANFSKADHHMEDLDQVVEAFIHRMHIDKEWRQKKSDLLLIQRDWQDPLRIPNLWNTMGFDSPSADWINKYCEVFWQGQHMNTELTDKLRKKYEQHAEYKRLF